MVMVETSELIGPALDWAVAKCEGHNIQAADLRYQQFQYSTDWAQGGPIIDNNPEMQLWPWGGEPDERAGELQCACLPVSFEGGHRQKTWFGKTKLIAAMRCYVASKLGNEVEIPEELK